MLHIFNLQQIFFPNKLNQTDVQKYFRVWISQFRLCTIWTKARLEPGIQQWVCFIFLRIKLSIAFTTIVILIIKSLSINCSRSAASQTTSPASPVHVSGTQVEHDGGGGRNDDDDVRNNLHSSMISLEYYVSVFVVRFPNPLALWQLGNLTTVSVSECRVGHFHLFMLSSTSLSLLVLVLTPHPPRPGSPSLEQEQPGFPSKP